MSTSFVTCNRGRPLPSLPSLVQPPHFSTSCDARYHSTPLSGSLLAERKRRDPYLPPDPTDPPDNPLFEVVASVSSLASTQIGGIGGISLGYPLFLASTILILPITTSTLLCVFFVAYWNLGRSVGGFGCDAYDDDGGELEEDEDGTSDLLALVGAIASAGLLSPDGFTISATDSDGGMPAMGIGLLALGSIAIIASVFGQSETQKLAAAKHDDELEEANRRLMDEFDKKLKGPR